MGRPTDTAGWQALDAAHLLHPFSDARRIHAQGTRLIVRGEGVHVYEASGHKLLDAMSGLWSVALGYGRQELIDAAQRQMRTLPYYNSFFQCTNEPAIELAARLAKVTPPQFEHVFFTGSGSESIDTIIRLARHYWQLEGEPQRQLLISRWNAYHGSTIAGASLGGMKWMHEQGLLATSGVERIGEPYAFERAIGRDPLQFGVEAARELEAKILEVGPERVAAFIAEPVQGAGGVIVPPETYWPEIQRICDRYGILLASDEVICGFGRTGEWFGCETFGTRPDFLAIAKALSSGYLPIGGVMVGDRVARTLIEKGGEFGHGFTYSAHPTCAAVALENLAILERERIIERVRDSTAPYLQRRWRELGAHPLVGEARGIGMLGALELVRSKEPRCWFEPRGKVGELCRDICIRNGLVMRATRDTMIIAPPLVFTEADVDELIEKAWRSLDETHAEARREGLC